MRTQKMKPHIKSANLTLALLFWTVSSATAQQFEEKDRVIEQVIVIGEKASRSLKDTNSSVSVLTDEALKTMQNKSLSDAVSELPNVVALSGAVPDIRGVSGNGSAGGFNSISGGARARVSVLVDGVAEPFVADFTGDSGMWDIEQIEVFRGPQSTNNGRNSIAGAMYIKTKDPANEWEGAARLGYRTEESYIDTSTVVSGPIVKDTLSMRMSVQHRNADTLTDDEGFEENPPHYDLNEIETTKIRGKLLWAPSESFKALLSYSTSEESGDTGRIYYELTDLDARNKTFYRDITTEINTTSLKLEQSFAPGLSGELLLAHIDYNWGFNSYETTPEAQQQLAFEESSITLESKVNFNQSDTVNGFVGLFYFEREQDILSEGAFPYFGDDESDSKGIFGEVTFSLSDTIDLIIGARYERESQLRDFTYLPIEAQLDDEHSVLLPKVALQYEVSDTTTLAVSFRQGYNSSGGALNFAAQEYYYFDEEEVDTLEFSTRTSFNEGSMFLSTNWFFNEYNGYQALSSTRFITNMDKVTTYGVEGELQAYPSDQIKLTAGLGFLSTKIDDAGEGYTSANGNELNSAPQITANIGLNYWLTTALSIGASANYVDDYFGDLENTNDRKAGDYYLVRLTASYELENWLIAAFVNNATDEEAITVREPVGARAPQGYAAVVDPRNFGVSVTYSF